MKLKILLLPGVFFLLLMSVGCNPIQKKQGADKIKIAISKGHGSASYERYGKWISKADSNIIWVDIYHMSMDSAQNAIANCDGLIVSGGEDVNPDLHGKLSQIDRCEDIDYKRDTLEFMLLDYAFNHKMPVLGICRGQQIINVFLGGNLFLDLPTEKPSSIHHRCSRSDTCRHLISILKGSLLENIGHTDSSIVNSSHHQAVQFTANNVQAIAWAQDSVIEGITWIDTNNRSFMLGVQFHPEHLDFNHPLSGNIAIRFAQEAANYHINKRNNE